MKSIMGKPDSVVMHCHKYSAESDYADENFGRLFQNVDDVLAITDVQF